MRVSRADADATATRRAAPMAWTGRWWRLALVLGGGFLFWLLLGEAAQAEASPAVGGQAGAPSVRDAAGRSDSPDTDLALAAGDAEDAGASLMDSAEPTATASDSTAPDLAPPGSPTPGSTTPDFTTPEGSRLEATDMLGGSEQAPVGSARDESTAATTTVGRISDQLSGLVPLPEVATPATLTLPGPAGLGAPRQTGDTAVGVWAAETHAAAAGAAALTFAGSVRLAGHTRPAPPSLPDNRGPWPGSELAVFSASNQGPGQTKAILTTGLLFLTLAAVTVRPGLVDRFRRRAARPAVSPD